MEKKLTVVTPFYNAEQFLPDYFKTILQQSNQSLKVTSFVWVDDGSTDTTYPSLEQFITEHGLDIQLLKIDINSGPSIARDQGVQAARTNWIAYLDADDSWYTNTLTILLTYTQTDFDIVFSPYYVWQPGVSAYLYLLKSLLTTYSLQLPSLLEKQNCSVPLGVIHTKEIYLKAGGFPPYVLCGEDGVLWRRMICNEHASYTFNEDPIGLYLVRQNSQCRALRKFASGKYFGLDGQNPLGPNGQYLDGLNAEKLEQFLATVTLS